MPADVQSTTSLTSMLRTCVNTPLVHEKFANIESNFLYLSNACDRLVQALTDTRSSLFATQTSLVATQQDLASCRGSALEAQRRHSAEMKKIGENLASAKEEIEKRIALVKLELDKSIEESISSAKREVEQNCNAKASNDLAQVKQATTRIFQQLNTKITDSLSQLDARVKEQTVKLDKQDVNVEKLDTKLDNLVFITCDLCLSGCLPRSGRIHAEKLNISLCETPCDPRPAVIAFLTNVPCP